MRIFAAILFCMLFAHHEISAQNLREVSDPYEAEYFTCEGKPDARLQNHAREQYGYIGLRIVADLNFDGRGDVILSRSDRNGGTGCGNAGCAVAVFLKQSNNTYLGVNFGLHPDAAALKKINRGEGQLVTYWRSNADEGVLSFYSVTEESVTLTSKETLHINTSDEDKKSYQGLFYGNHALKAEYSYCQNGHLQWKGSYE